MLSVQTSDSPEVAELALKAAGYEVEKTEEGTQTASPAETEKPKDKEPAGEVAGETKPEEKPAEAAATTETVKPAEGSVEKPASEAASGDQGDKGKEKDLPGSARTKLKNQKLQAEVQRLAVRVQELESKPASAAAETKAIEPKPRPKREDFLTSDDPDKAYDDAREDWLLAEGERRAEVRQAKKVETDKQAESAKASKTALEQWEDKQTAARDQFEDFDEVTSDTPVSVAMAHVIMGVEDSARLYYELGKNHPELALRLVVQTDLPQSATDAQRAAAAKLAKIEIQKALPAYFEKASPVKDAAPNGTQVATPAANGNNPGKKTAPKLPAPPPPKVGASSAGEKVGTDFEAIARGSSPIADFEKATRPEQRR